MPKRRVKPSVMFSNDDLYKLWLNFKDDENAITILSDFMVATKEEAKILDEQFEIRYQSSVLDGSNRGKTDRIRKHI